MNRFFLFLVAGLLGAGTSFFIFEGRPSMAFADTPSPAELGISEATSGVSSQVEKKTAIATFGTGCFWCTEACFQQLKGVVSVTSGYTGGKTKNPTYKEVCNGETGHAEAIQVVYDPKIITYVELLEVFWKIHDPTTLNRQGNDVGTQYRSAIFTHTEEQKKQAEEYKSKLDKSGAFKDPIVTEITPASVFYPAEDYHQNYFKLNGSQPYCQYVIKPKMDKFKSVFKDKLQTGK